MPSHTPRRVAVYGNSGSGKTTFGRALADALALPFVELDSVFHARPNWDDLSDADFRAAVSALLLEHRQGWVMDGNYSRVRDLILAEADTAIWLKLPFQLVYWRLAKRTIVRSFQHAPLWNGNYESLRQTFLSRDSMLLWGITSWRRSRRNTAEVLRTARPGVNVVILRSPGKVSGFLKACRARRVDAVDQTLAS